MLLPSHVTICYTERVRIGLRKHWHYLGWFIFWATWASKHPPDSSWQQPLQVECGTFLHFPFEYDILPPHNIWHCRYKQRHKLHHELFKHHFGQDQSPLHCSDKGKRLYKWYALGALALKAQTENDIYTLKIDLRNMTRYQRCLGIKQHYWISICSF